MIPATLDSVCRGELTLLQPRDGYRFNVDSLILADFVRRAVHPAPSRAADLGAGCGVVGLLLAQRWPGCSVTLVELQADLALLALENARYSSARSRVRVVRADLRQVAAWAPEPPELLVCNPPFFPGGSGRASPVSQIALARHELCCTLGELCAAAAAALRPGGQLALIHDARREQELLCRLRQVGLEPALLQRVLPLPGRAPRRVLLTARAGTATAGPQELPPLLVEQAPGEHSAALRALLGERAPEGAPPG